MKHGELYVFLRRQNNITDRFRNKSQKELFTGEESKLSEDQCEFFRKSHLGPFTRVIDSIGVVWIKTIEFETEFNARLELQVE